MGGEEGRGPVGDEVWEVKGRWQQWVGHKDSSACPEWDGRPLKAEAWRALMELSGPSLVLAVGLGEDRQVAGGAGRLFRVLVSCRQAVELAGLGRRPWGGRTPDLPSRWA